VTGTILSCLFVTGTRVHGRYRGCVQGVGLHPVTGVVCVCVYVCDMTSSAGAAEQAGTKHVQGVYTAGGNTEGAHPATKPALPGAPPFSVHRHTQHLQQQGARRQRRRQQQESHLGNNQLWSTPSGSTSTTQAGVPLSSDPCTHSEQQAIHTHHPHTVHAQRGVPAAGAQPAAAVLIRPV
jgi:hypothetical protein